MPPAVRLLGPALSVLERHWFGSSSAELVFVERIRLVCSSLMHCRTVYTCLIGIGVRCAYRAKVLSTTIRTLTGRALFLSHRHSTSVEPFGQRSGGSVWSLLTESMEVCLTRVSECALEEWNAICVYTGCDFPLLCLGSDRAQLQPGQKKKSQDFDWQSI